MGVNWQLTNGKKKTNDNWQIAENFTDNWYSLSILLTTDNRLIRLKFIVYSLFRLEYYDVNLFRLVLMRFKSFSDRNHHAICSNKSVKY